MDPAALQPLRSLINNRPESFASECEDIQTAALTATKFLFDLAVQSEKRSGSHITGLLGSLRLLSAPQTRSQDIRNRKRRRTPSPASRAAFESTPITSLFVDGMNEKQVWAQLDLRTELVCNALDRVLEGEPDWGDEDDLSGESDAILNDSATDQVVKALGAAARRGEIDFGALKGSDDLPDEDTSLEDENREDVESEEEVNDGSEDDAAEGIAGLQDSSSDESEGDDPTSLGSARDISKVLRERRSELDDGFFDLVSFNKETRQAEARSSSRGRLGDEDGESNDEEELFLDLFNSQEAELGGDGLEGVYASRTVFKKSSMSPVGATTMYGDFFEPPSTFDRRSVSKYTKSSLKCTSQVRFNQEVRVKKIKATGKNLPLYIAKEDGEGEWESMEDDIQRQHGSPQDVLAPDHSFDEAASPHAALKQSHGRDDGSSSDQDQDDVVARLEDDLFADEESNPYTNLSTHEKRMGELREQIVLLESENVGPKDWVLLGEATSRARPQNSLLEEDLEFERAMKVAPYITEEKVLDLEERIKARILEGRFDDVIRRRKVEDKPFLPSRILELKDTKSTQSLAQIYENEFVASRTGGVAGEDRDAKLKKEHDDIVYHWEKICHKLDALCNAHFTPKPPKASISTVVNISATSLESALPSTKSPANILAPEEVFAPSTAEPRARSELTPFEKRSLRHKERKMKKKLRDRLEMKVTKVRGIGGIKKQQKAVLDTVVKSGKGITIVGKSGRKEPRLVKDQ